VTTLRFGYANVQSKARGAKHMAAQGFDGLVTVETNGLEDLQLEGYTPFYGGRGHPDRRSHDTCVWRRNDHVQIGVLGYRVARPSEPERIAGLPRFASCQILGGTGLGLPVALWGLHLHYIGKAYDEPATDRVAKTSEGMDNFLILLDAFESMGIANVVLGDMNVPRTRSTEGWQSPWDVFDALNFTVFDYGIDGGGISPKLRLVTWDKIPMARFRTAHDGAAVEVAKADTTTVPLPEPTRK
jgi:hypothetical protein